MTDAVLAALITGLVGVVGIGGTLAATHLQLRSHREVTSREERRQIYFEIIQKLQDLERSLTPLDIDPTTPSPARSEWILETRAKVQSALDSSVKAYLIAPYLVAHIAEETANRMLERMLALVEGRPDALDVPFWDALIDAMRQDLGTDALERNITDDEKRMIEKLYGD